MGGLITYPTNHVDRAKIIRHWRNYSPMPDNYLLNATLIDSHTQESKKQMWKDNHSLRKLGMQT